MLPKKQRDRWDPSKILEDIREEDYEDLASYMHALDRAAPSELLKPLPNRSIRVLYGNDVFWMRPLGIGGRTVLCRVQTNPHFAKYPTTLTWGQVVEIDVSQILNISGWTNAKCREIIEKILANEGA